MKDLNQFEIEKKWQKKWKEDKIFEPKIENSKEKFFATVPYPYANSVLHIGHGRGYATPDLFIRFQRLQSKNVLFPLGFHISGTPVLAVSDAIKKGEKKQIKLTKSAIAEYVKDKIEQEKILNSFKDPYEIAKFFSSTIEGSLDSLGISIDWSRQFSTGDIEYQKFVEWQFKKLDECKILVQGKYPILYSPKDKNAVGEDDIKDGDVDKVSLSEMTYILFELKDGYENEKCYVCVATLRADALFGTTNLWVDSKMDLIRIKINNQIWLVSKDSLTKLKHQFEDVKLLSSHKGLEFVDKLAITPITHREVILANANFIDSKHGTGMVYSSPAGSPHDFMALKEAKLEGRLPENLEVINTVIAFDKKGNEIKYNGTCPAEDKILKYKISNSTDPNLEIAKQELYKEEHFAGKLNENCAEFEGMYIKKAKDLVAKKLTELNLGGILYETSRRATTRSGDDVIVANLDGQWFLNYKDEKIKQKAYDLLDSMSYKPNKLKETQMGYLNWVEMRPCARKRGIGTPLPNDKSWVIESLSDSTIYQMLYLIFGIIKKKKITSKSLTPDLFDYLFLNIGEKIKISKKTQIAPEILDEMTNQINYWKSFDFRYTASAHLSNHLSFLIYHYALIFPKQLQPKEICIGGMLIRDGEKISKSKGNGIPLVQVPKKFGADLYRLYIALAANYDVEMDFKDDDIFQLSKKFDKLKSILYGSSSKKLKKLSELSKINQWLISKFYSRVKEYFKDFNDMRIREAFVGVIYEFLNDISYHERRTSENETLEVLRFILKDYLKILTPAIPHICEELWEKLGENSYISIQAFNSNIENFINLEIEELENISINIISQISRQKESSEKILTKLIIVQASKKRFELFDLLGEILNKTKNFKEIFSNLLNKFPDDKKFISKFVPKTLGSNGLSTYLNFQDEKDLINSLSNFIKLEFNLDLEIKTAEDLNLNSINLIPGKPVIILE